MSLPRFRGAYSPKPHVKVRFPARFRRDIRSSGRAEAVSGARPPLLRQVRPTAPRGVFAAVIRPATGFWQSEKAKPSRDCGITKNELHKSTKA